MCVRRTVPQQKNQMSSRSFRTRQPVNTQKDPCQPTRRPRTETSGLRVFGPRPLGGTRRVERVPNDSREECIQHMGDGKSELEVYDLLLERRAKVVDLEC